MQSLRKGASELLLRFVVSNHRSVAKSVELSMIAVDDDRPAVRSFDRLNERVLTVAGLYGPNASGKSNLLRAISWLSRAVRQSLRSWDVAIPRTPFKFADWPQAPSTFEVEMMVGGVRYEYRLEVDSSKVIFEGLYSYPERRRRSLFEREGLEINFRRGLGGVSGIRGLLTPTTLALAAALRFREPEIGDFGLSLRSVGSLWPRRLRRDQYEGATWDLFFGQREVDQQTSTLALLRYADLGIEDVEFVEERVGSELSQHRIRLIHKVGDQRLPFDLTEESGGTQTWFRLVGPVLNALEMGRVLLFDEIDASLHPRLSVRLLELFQDPETNPHGAQLVFTTHDTSLLNHLNRDEVWLTEKDGQGATTLTALAEFGGDKVRRSLNLERAYLQGRFGAVPELDQRPLRDALGLAAGET